MEWCSINGCYSYRLPRRVMLYRLFRGGKFKEEWIKQILDLNCQYIDTKRPSHLGFRVCEIHFEQSCKNPEIPGRLHLRAVPTIFPKMYYFIIKRNENTYSTIVDPEVIRPHIFQVEQDTNKSETFCGVPQCNTLRLNKNGIHLFRIPRDVMLNTDLLLKWSRLICVEPPFPKNFSICSLHFPKDDILPSAFTTPDQQKYPMLSSNAIPILYLPKPTVLDINLSKEELERAISFGRTRLPTELEEKNNECDINSNPSNEVNQENLNKCIPLGSYYDLTGLDDKSSLDALVNQSLKIEEKMAMRKRIILTLCRLKTNRDFKQLAALFGIDYKTITSCFADTIQQLAGIFGYLRNFGLGFKNSTITFIKIAIQTDPILEVIIGVAPSGHINYVSSMSSAGIQMVEPKMSVVQHSSVSALGMKRQIEKLKEFKFISEPVDESLVPFIDDIMIVLCGILNNSLLNKRTKQQ